MNNYREEEELAMKNYRKISEGANKPLREHH